MSFKLSEFGSKFTAQSGIVALMDDLGTALNENPDLLFMGGGNPARIDAVEEYFAERLNQIQKSDKERFDFLGVYQSPQGDVEFKQELASYLKTQFDWPITAENIALTNGSQSAFFTVANMLAGKMDDGSNRTIHFPLAPEYVGYADAGLSEALFSSSRPKLDILDQHYFKYRVNFDELDIDDSVAALCVSRPTNPTGNVITDSELAKLDLLAKERQIPLIIDGAYGLPFPDITFSQATPHWNSNTILLLSLSKLGLPAVRTGIVIADKAFIQQFTTAYTIMNLTPSSTGPILARGLFAERQIESLTASVKQHYQDKVKLITECFIEHLDGVDFKIHSVEGAIFVWLWFKDLPVSSYELYQRLKQQGVLIIPGEEFFIQQKDWSHSKECIRVSYAQPDDVIKQGVKIIANEVKDLYPK